MSVGAVAAAAARAEAITRLGTSFKHVQVALRRLRGRETQRQGAPSFAQYQLLFTLADRDGLSSGEIAAAAELSPATVTQMLDALAEQGLVARSRSDHDRRIVTCSLTDAGRTLIAERRATFEGRWHEALHDFVTGDLEIAAEVLDRIASMFDDFDAAA
jgi:DNA-binding MarR family transcriptional regulator